jgi:hypothetical protein
VKITIFRGFVAGSDAGLEAVEMRFPKHHTDKGGHPGHRPHSFNGGGFRAMGPGAVSDHVGPNAGRLFPSWPGLLGWTAPRHRVPDLGVINQDWSRP